MQHSSTNYNYIHAPLAGYVELSDVALIAMAVTGWAVAWLLRWLFAGFAERHALRRALAEKQLSHENSKCRTVEAADTAEQPTPNSSPVPAPSRSAVKANAEARRRARRQERAKDAAVQLLEAAPSQEEAVEASTPSSSPACADAEAEACEAASSEVSGDIVADACVSKRKKRRTRKAKQAQSEIEVPEELTEASAQEQEEPQETAVEADAEATVAHTEKPAEVSGPVTPVEDIQVPAEDVDCKKDDAASEGDDDDDDTASTGTDGSSGEDTSSSCAPSREQSYLGLDEAPPAPPAPEPKEEEQEVQAQLCKGETALATDSNSDAASDSSSEADLEELLSLLAQKSAQVPVPAPMTPLRKEVMKLERRMRKIEALKARRQSGETLDVLQHAAIERAPGLRTELEAARHQLAVEAVMLYEQPSHCYVWDAPEVAYYCMPSGQPEDLQAYWPAAASWGGDDGWNVDMEAPGMPPAPTRGRRSWCCGRGRRSSKPKPWEEEDWDLCWSFRNKGFCARGANCTWRHEGDAKVDMEAPLSEEEKRVLQERVELLNGEQLDAIFEFLAPDLSAEEEAEAEEAEEAEVCLDPDTLSPQRQRALFKLVERASETLAQDSSGPSACADGIAAAPL